MKLRGVLRSAQVKEEVQAFVLAEFEQAPRAPLAPPPEEEPPPAEEKGLSPEEVEALRASWEAEWQARLERERAQAEAEAYERGYAAAQEALKDDLEAQRQAAKKVASRLTPAWSDFLKASEPLLSELAFEVAETLLDAPLPSDIKEISTRALAEALEELGAEAPIRIALHPVDFLQLEESGMAEQLGEVHRGLAWEPNPDLRQGDWVAQSPVAAVRRLRDELICKLKDRITSATAQHDPTGDASPSPPRA